ncbi:MAG: galactitol-1-phosphate 5-dehydrogenase [Lachnospiraceae bacterium]|nr:galactitol-1-phosphate 5-dehydrogenase [Lachnospiraceae bacterium]
MKAMVLHNLNDFRLETVEEPQPKTGEVVVEVKAVGVCGSDIPRVYYTGTYSYPLIPGHEFSGVVIAAGSNVDDKWLGKRVGVFPLIPCKTCIPCQNKQYEMCRHYSYLGSRRNGAFAEYVAVPEGNLIELPESVSFEEAAMLEPMAVSVHAMRRISPSPTDVVAVCGLGTIGLLLLMFLREAGIKNILAVGNKDRHKRWAQEFGVLEEEYCDNRVVKADEWLKEKTGGAGADVFFECVGKKETVVQAVNTTAPGGRICLVGNPETDIMLERETYWKILRNQMTLTGTWNSSFTHDAEDDWNYVLERLAANRIMPGKIISHKFSLENLMQGFHIMRDKTEDYGKIMCVIKKNKKF